MSISSEKGSSIFYKTNNCFTYLVTLLVICFIAALSNDESYGLQYSNYTSAKYQIEFQYPTNWQITEKVSRFDEGTDIKVQGPSPIGLITIQHLNSSLIQGLDLRAAVYDFFKESISGDYTKEYKVIEQPSFITIDGQNAGTYLYTFKDKYEEFASKWASQIWTVYAGDHGYLLSFLATTDLFDGPEMKEIREQFIKSIHFTGAGNITGVNISNRFD